MQKYLFIVLLSMLLLIPVQAQNQTLYGNTSITSANVTDMILTAQLQLEPIENVTNFVQNEIEWSLDGEWLGIGYGYMAYAYNINRLQNSPYAFDMRYTKTEGCGSIADHFTVRDITFSHDGSYIAITNEAQLRIYDLSNGEQISSQQEIYVTDLEFLANGHLQTISSPHNLSWNPESQQFRVENNTVWTGSPIETSPNGLLYGAYSNGSVAQLNSITGAQVQLFEPPECEVQVWGGGCGFPPDTDHLTVSPNALAGQDSDQCADIRHTNVWDTRTGTVIQEFPFLSDFMALNNAGDLIVLDSQDETQSAGIYSVSSGALLHTLPATENTIDAKFNPDGSLLATINEADGRVQLWTVPDNLPSRNQLLALSSVVVDANCDNTQSVTQGVTVSIGWSWYARTQEQLFDHINAADYDYRVNGTMPQRWLLMSRPERYAPHGEDTWTIFYYLPLGTETSGNHVAGYTVGWRELISDGFGLYGNTGDVIRVSETCDYIVS